MSDIIRLWKSPAGYAEGIDAIFEKPNRVVKQDVVRATKGVMQVLQDATNDAEKIIADARLEAETIRKLAYDEGVQSGYNDTATQLLSATKEYHSARKTAEKDAITFAFQVANRIIGKSLENDPSLVVSCVSEVLSQVTDQKNIIILVHADDLQLLHDNKHQLLDASQGSPFVFEASEKVNRGECIIETDDGKIDGRLATQLHALEHSLKEDSP